MGSLLFSSLFVLDVATESQKDMTTSSLAPLALQVKISDTLCTLSSKDAMKERGLDIFDELIRKESQNDDVTLPSTRKKVIFPKKKMFPIRLFISNVTSLK